MFLRRLHCRGHTIRESLDPLRPERADVVHGWPVREFLKMI